MGGKLLHLFPWSPLAADNFAAFWQLYPKRTHRIEALRAWAKLGAQDRIECLRRTPLFVREWERKCTERHFIPNPASFINGRRWEDELDDEATPLGSLGQCEWNRNGNRDEGKPRCPEPGRYQNQQGQYYCPTHSEQLGAKPRKVSG